MSWVPIFFRSPPVHKPVEETFPKGPYIVVLAEMLIVITSFPTLVPDPSHCSALKTATIVPKLAQYVELLIECYL